MSGGPGDWHKGSDLSRVVTLFLAPYRVKSLHDLRIIEIFRFLDCNNPYCLFVHRANSVIGAFKRLVIRLRNRFGSVRVIYLKPISHRSFVQ